MTRNTDTGGRRGPARVRVIGVGSPFGDDALGWDAVEALARAPELSCYPDDLVSLQCVDRPGASLLETLAVPGLVILVDAMQSGRPPGTVRALDPDELDETGCLMSTHDFGIEPALHLARALGEVACEVRIFGIEMDPGARDATRGNRRAAMETDNLIRFINELIKDFLRRRPYPQAPDLVRIKQ